MTRIVVTGAGRGLGLGFTRFLLDRGDQVLALARRPGSSLEALARAHPGRLHAVACDVGDDAAVAAAAARAQQLWGAIDVLLNNAGVAGRTPGGLEDLDWDDLRGVFDVNVLGPLRTSRAFAGLLARGSAPKIIHVTSRMGSIGDNQSGGWWAYRISKAGLNMAAANLALELRPLGIAVMVLHPGWVRTDMGGASAPLDVSTSVAGMVGQIDRLDLAETGCFLDWEGATVPW